MNFLNIGLTRRGLDPCELGRDHQSHAHRRAEKLQESQATSGSLGDVRGECLEDGRMIGAMPAVAVRHERRRQEKRTKRPSMLFLQSPQSRSATPSPLQSPPPCHQAPPPEIYVCGKVSVLHVVVVSLLLGAVLLIVGLAQLKPGAEASHHRYLLLGIGSFLLLLGVVLAIIRCCVLPWAAKRHAPILPETLPAIDDPEIKSPTHLPESEHLAETT